jgi:hypothetical protein
VIELPYGCLDDSGYGNVQAGGGFLNQFQERRINHDDLQGVQGGGEDMLEIRKLHDIGRDSFTVCFL